MASCSNLKIGQLVKIEKGKEKTESAATGESWDGNTESATTRTSRGRTHLDKLARLRVQGIRKVVAFNRLGQPIGEAAVEMQSYIGVLAREKVKISYKTWKQVPMDVKELIWESVNVSNLACFTNYRTHILMITLMLHLNLFNVFSLL